jgi:hypothetical protein
MIVRGCGLYGKVDEAPKLFHVATLFRQAGFVPIVPLRSFLVLKGVGDSFEVKEIPLSWKSVLVAWLQWLSLVGAFFGFLAAIKHLTPAAGLLCALNLGLFAFLKWSKTVRGASYARARELAAIADLPPERQTLLEFLYGRISADEARQAMRTRVAVEVEV